MPIVPITARTPPSPQQAARAASGVTIESGSFAAQLAAGVEAADARSPESVRVSAREAASQFLADLFYAPLLAEMRKTPFGREFAHGGRGEDVFGEQLDQRLGEAVARRDHSGLTARLAQGLACRDPDGSATPARASHAEEST